MTDADRSIAPPSNRTAFEVAVDLTAADRMEGVGAPGRIAKRPLDAPAAFLPFLAYERSVDIWDDDWDELKKRNVIASSFRDHALKGTLAGARRYIEIAGGELRQVVRRPQGFVVSRNLTKGEQDAWIAKHPRVRVTLSSGNGIYCRRRGVFVGHSGIGVDWLKLNEGRALYGRKAVLSQNGVETPLQLSEVETTEEGRTAVIERFAVRGFTRRGLIVGAAAVGRNHVGQAGRASKVYTFAIDKGYVHRTSALALIAVPVGYEARDVQTVRVSEVGVAGKRMFVGRAPIGTSGIDRDRGAHLLADVLYLVDPSIDVPRIKARSYVGFSRISMPHHSADLLIDWKRRIDMRRRFVLGSAPIGRRPLHVLDTEHRDFMLRAVDVSRRLSDHVRVSFQTTRERTLSIGAPLDGSVMLGDRAPNRL